MGLCTPLPAPPVPDSSSRGGQPPHAFRSAQAPARSSHPGHGGAAGALSPGLSSGFDEFAVSLPVVPLWAACVLSLLGSVFLWIWHVWVWVDLALGTKF